MIIYFIDTGLLTLHKSSVDDNHILLRHIKRRNSKVSAQGTFFKLILQKTLAAFSHRKLKVTQT